MCGGNIQAEPEAAFGACDSCGITSTLPKVNDMRIVNLFNRANHLRRRHEFDRALSTYENILIEDTTNAEAHWCVVLCRYGVEYVEDPKTSERIPTCHRTQFAPVLADADYLAALEYAPDSYTKGLYEEAAKRLHEIQMDILAISSQEVPYDVFICYKESTESGSRTKDSVLAQDIYIQLTNEGWKVFFARISLEDQLGRKFEPYIFNALNTARAMLVIGTQKEYFEAVWVKNEWSRYLTLMKNDRSRLLIPCYLDIDVYDLPEELSYFQALDMSKDEYIQNLIKAIQKVAPKKKPEPKSDTSTNHNQVKQKSFEEHELDLLKKRYSIITSEEGFASAENDFQKLALKFLKIGSVESVKLAKKCEETYLALIEQREKHEYNQMNQRRQKAEARWKKEKMQFEAMEESRKDLNKKIKLAVEIVLVLIFIFVWIAIAVIVT